MVIPPVCKEADVINMLWKPGGGGCQKREPILLGNDTHGFFAHLPLQPCLPLDGLHDNGFPPSFEVYDDQLHGLVVRIEIAGVPVIQKMLAQPQNGGHPSATLLDLMTEGLQCKKKDQFARVCRTDSHEKLR